MKPRTIITIILLLFVAASVAYLVVGEAGGRPGIAEKPAEPVIAVPPAADPAAVNPRPDTPPTDDPATSRTTASPETYVNVYYFHGYYRCITCRTIEMYTREAVNEAFLKELGGGSLHLLILNMQDPVNDGYVKDFELEYNVVVLEKVVDGKRIDWKKLEGVWDLLGDKDRFKKYVRDETRAYLKETN